MAYMKELKVLWVDDNDMIRFTGKELLKSLNCHPTTAESAEEALTLLQNDAFDVLIFDLGLPGMDGWELTEQIKDDYPSMKRILMSGWNDNSDQERLESLRIDRILDKPVLLAELKEALESVCG